MAIDTASRRTRRAILLGALGGAAAAAVSTVGRAAPVGAADGTAILVGGTYTATTITELDATGGATGLKGGSDSGVGVVGHSDSGFGVIGSTASGLGVKGTSSSGNGVEGKSVASHGLYGDSYATDAAAVLGQSYANSTGMMGFSGGDPATPPTAPAKTGVYGYADQDAAAVGVKGQSVLGTGGLFTAGANGTSLRATGRVKFDKAAGVATVAAGTNGVTVTPGIDLTSTSAVVATLQGVPSGTAMVKSVAVNPTANTFTIYLSANATHATKVAWHVFG